MFTRTGAAFQRSGKKLEPSRPVPREAITLYREALKHSGKGNPESAINCLNQALLLAPNFTSALCQMGNCYEKIGQYHEALSKFDQVLQIDPSHAEAEVNSIRVRKKI